MKEKTSYPFRFPAGLESRLPSPRQGDTAYIDVKVGGGWEGVLVINDSKLCVGIRCDRQTSEFPLGFSADEIEDVRPASLWNRTLAALPSRLVLALPYAFFLIAPLLVMAFDYNYSPAGSLLAIFLGLVSQRIVIEHLKAYGLFNILLVIAIFGIQASLIVHMIKQFLK